MGVLRICRIVLDKPFLEDDICPGESKSMCLGKHGFGVHITESLKLDCVYWLAQIIGL